MAEAPTERDFRSLTAVVEEGWRDEPTDGMTWAVLNKVGWPNPLRFCEFYRTRSDTRLAQREPFPRIRTNYEDFGLLGWGRSSVPWSYNGVR